MLLLLHTHANTQKKRKSSMFPDNRRAPPPHDFLSGISPQSFEAAALSQRGGGEVGGWEVLLKFSDAADILRTAQITSAPARPSHPWPPLTAA